jgi:hypothetical protein
LFPPTEYVVLKERYPAFKSPMGWSVVSFLLIIHSKTINKSSVWSPESPKEKYHLEDQGVDGRMGSKWILRRLVGGCGVDSPDSG